MTQAFLKRAGLALASLIPFLALLAYFAASTRPSAQVAAKPPTPSADAAPAASTGALSDDAVPPSGHTDADFDRMVDSLRAKLAKHPEDVEGWVLLARTLGNGRRWADAEAAFRQALARKPDEPALHVQLGEVLVMKANGQVGRAALAEFARLPEDPRARFYAAVGLAQSGDKAGARAKLAALLADAPAQASWRSLVTDEIADLDKIMQAQPAASGPDTKQAATVPATATVPTPATVPATASVPAPATASGPAPASASAASPATATAAPIAKLEERVRAAPQDAEAWLALSRAYEATGDRGHAADTLRRANQAVPGNLDLLLSAAQLQADGIKGDALPESFVAILRQVEAIDPNQPDALWYLGLDAAARGDTHRARAVWERLLARLPESSDEHAAVAERLKSLRPFVKP